MTLASNSARQTPAYIDHSGNNPGSKYHRKRTDVSTHSFIELHDRTSSNEELKGKQSRRTSYISNESTTPIADLVPKDYGIHTSVGVKGIGHERPENGFKSSGILVSQTVDQHHSMRNQT